MTRYLLKWLKGILRKNLAYLSTRLLEPASLLNLMKNYSLPVYILEPLTTFKYFTLNFCSLNRLRMVESGFAILGPNFNGKKSAALL